MTEEKRIKDAYDIYLKIVGTQLDKRDSYWHEKWVSLDWLKTKIQAEIDSVNTWKSVDHSYQSGLNRVLTLLEQEENDHEKSLH